jgi:VanZ family protein
MMALIFVASGSQGSELPKFGIWDFAFKKGGHLIGYGLLGVAYLHGLTRGIFRDRRALLLAILLAGLYAITDEFHQSFTPGRTPSPVDVGIDTVGASLGAALGAWLRSRPAP